MSEQQRRKDLVAEYQRTGTEAGVYRIVNRATGRALLGRSTNLEGIRNRFAYARSTDSADALDGRLRDDIGRYGLDGFELEVVEVLARRPEGTDAELRDELVALEELVREGCDPDLLY